MPPACHQLTTLPSTSALRQPLQVLLALLPPPPAPPPPGQVRGWQEKSKGHCEPKASIPLPRHISPCPLDPLITVPGEELSSYLPPTLPQPSPRTRSPPLSAPAVWAPGRNKGWGGQAGEFCRAAIGQERPPALLGANLPAGLTLAPRDWGFELPDAGTLEPRNPTLKYHLGLTHVTQGQSQPQLCLLSNGDRTWICESCGEEYASCRPRGWSSRGPGKSFFYSPVCCTPCPSYLKAGVPAARGLASHLGILYLGQTLELSASDIHSSD